MIMTEEAVQGIKKRYEEGIITKERLDAFMNAPGPEYVPPIVMYLALDQAANINGQVFGCDGGRIALYSEPVEIQGIYKNFRKDGAWTLDELIDLVPKTLLVGYKNPAPPEPPKDKAK